METRSANFNHTQLACTKVFACEAQQRTRISQRRLHNASMVQPVNHFHVSGRCCIEPIASIEGFSLEWACRARPMAHWLQLSVNETTQREVGLGQNANAEANNINNNNNSTKVIIIVYIYMNIHGRTVACLTLMNEWLPQWAHSDVTSGQYN